jgi:hypothetical protein
MLHGLHPMAQHIPLQYGQICTQLHLDNIAIELDAVLLAQHRCLNYITCIPVTMSWLDQRKRSVTDAPAATGLAVAR